MSISEEPFPVVGASPDAARIANLAMAFVFSSALTWTYANSISQYWSYLGFTYFKPDLGLFALAMTAAVMPSLLLPLRASRGGDFIIWVIYFGLYIPSVLMPMQMGNLSYNQSLALVGSLLAAILIICLPPPGQSKMSARPLIAMNASLFWGCFTVVYVSLILWVIFSFGGHIQLVGFRDIYTQRAAASDAAQGSLIGYAPGFLSGAFNPFLMAVGLTKRRYWMVALGAAGQIFVFATFAMKSELLSVVLIPAFYFLVFRKEPFRLGKIGLAFTVPAVGLAFVAANVYEGGVRSLFQIAFTLLYMRTFCMVGVLTGVYTEFFLTHSLTYYSHINFMRMYVHYPYSDTLGEIIGSYMDPIAPMDANASFFATDGVAALGYWGIVISGLLFRLFIALFDICSDRKHVALVACAIIPVLVSVMNASLFTTLLTFGGGALALLLYLYCNATPGVAKPAVTATG